MCLLYTFWMGKGHHVFATASILIIILIVAVWMAVYLTGYKYTSGQLYHQFLCTTSANIGKFIDHLCHNGLKYPV